MAVDLLETLLARSLEHFVQFLVPVVQLPVQIPPQPHPAAPLIRRFPPRSVENALMMTIKVYLAAGYETLLFIRL